MCVCVDVSTGGLDVPVFEPLLLAVEQHARSVEKAAHGQAVTFLHTNGNNEGERRTRDVLGNGERT